MVNIIKKLIGFFSIYTDPFEKKVGKFFDRISSKPGRYQKKKLLELMQTDLVRVNLFLEYKFKGYKNLKKSYRHKRYRDAEAIKKAFQNSLRFGKRLATDEKLNYLMQIARFLRPGNHFHYQESSAFEKLLRNPETSKLVGDCNQIVTLYIYLYSLKYPITDLKIKLLPDHVCLHYDGKDIEATRGMVTEYKHYEFIASIEEIISTNLLDIPDQTQKQFRVSAKNLLKAAKLAKAISSHQHLTNHNLKVAYQQVVAELLKEKRFKQARELSKESSIKEMEGWIDQSELHHLLETIKHCQKLSDYKAHKSKLKRIELLAKRTNQKELEKFCKDLLYKL